MSELLADLKYAFRTFRRSPLHAFVTILILGMGIGAVTLMFSALNAVFTTWIIRCTKPFHAQFLPDAIFLMLNFYRKKVDLKKHFSQNQMK